MQQLTQQSNQISTTAKSNQQPKWIFCLQLHSGAYVLGLADNCPQRIAIINSGCNRAVRANSVNRIVAIKPTTEERTLESVVYKFCERYGSDNVITV